MKTKILILLVSAVFAAMSTAQEANRMFGVWKVNWGQTSPAIQSVPDSFRNRFSDVDEFRAFVAEQAKEMTLEILPDNTGILRRGPDYRPGTYRWKSAKRYDCWLEIGGLLAAGVGHGFKVTDARNAILTFQIEWSENVATRIPLHMERQVATPQAPK